MIIEIENDNGEQLGVIRIKGTQEFEAQIETPDDRVSLADIDYDDIMDTNEAKVRISLNNIKEDGL